MWLLQAALLMQMRRISSVLVRTAACSVETIFDQPPEGNHLVANHPGRHFPVDRGVSASAHPIVVSGHTFYGAWFDMGMGYRNDNTSGLAVGTEPESIYAVFGGHHPSLF
jgi:hypothetical protein